MARTKVGRRAAIELPADELVIDCEERAAGISWPLAVDRWLEARLDQARAAGIATSRKELAAALMTARVPDDEDLVALLRDYRRQRVRGLLTVPADETVVEFVRQRPGPRRRGSS